ncbi:hypothetical protein P3W53_07120 [Pseudomonas denitrificans (nom. rej.)]|nr:hypothetical protein [Pseudomonas denitrificans (nom. rej.)]
MLTAEQVAAMTADELAAAVQDNLVRRRQNNDRCRYAAGIAGKGRRGGSKLRVWRVAKPDQVRLKELQEEGRSILRDGDLLMAERNRRSHAEKARA